MVICVDCDNVLCDLQDTVIKIFNDRYGTSYTIDDFTSYNIMECINLKDALNMTNIYGEPGLYDLVKPLKNSKNIIQKLKRSGHEVYVVTDAIPGTFSEKANWINMHLGIDNEHIVSMKHKWLFKCDVMIEDNMDNLLGGHHYDRICFDYPWNKHTRDEVYGINRVQGWNEAFDVINKINKKWSGVTA